MIVTSMRLTTSSRRDIAVLRKESSSLEGEEDVKMLTTYHTYSDWGLRRTQSASTAPPRRRGRHRHILTCWPGDRNMKTVICVILLLSITACATCKSSDSYEVCRTKQRDHSQARP